MNDECDIEAQNKYLIFFFFSPVFTVNFFHAHTSTEHLFFPQLALMFIIRALLPVLVSFFHFFPLINSLTRCHFSLLCNLEVKIIVKVCDSFARQP